MRLARGEERAGNCITQQEKHYISAVSYSNKPHAPPVGGIVTVHLSWLGHHCWGDPPALRLHQAKLKSDAGDCFKSFVSGNTGLQDARTSAPLDDTLLLSVALV